MQKKKELLAANQHRENLEDFEEWNYIKDVAKAEGWVHEDGKSLLATISKELGIEYNRLRMLQDSFEGTDKELQKAIKKGKITTSDAQTISSLNLEDQKQIAKEALASDEGMGRKDIRSKVKEIRSDKIKEEYGVKSFELEESEEDEN